MSNASAVLGDRVAMVDDSYEVLEGADALVIFTDWPKFRTPDFDRMGEAMNQKVVFDGRNLFEPKTMANHGFHYACVGRPSMTPQ